MKTQLLFYTRDFRSCNFCATKIALSCATKIACVNGPSKPSNRPGNIFIQPYGATLLHCKLNELMPVLPPPAQLATQKISVLQVAAICCESRAEFYFLQHFFQLATMNLQRFSTCNATLLRDRLNENVYRITWP